MLPSLSFSPSFLLVFFSLVVATAFGKLTGSRNRAAYWIISGACRRRESGRPAEFLLSSVSIDLPRARTSTGARSRRTSERASERSSGSAPRRDATRRTAPKRARSRSRSRTRHARTHAPSTTKDEGQRRAHCLTNERVSADSPAMEVTTSSCRCFVSLSPFSTLFLFLSHDVQPFSRTTGKRRQWSRARDRYLPTPRLQHPRGRAQIRR